MVYYRNTVSAGSKMCTRLYVSLCVESLEKLWWGTASIFVFRERGDPRLFVFGLIEAGGRIGKPIVDCHSVRLNAASQPDSQRAITAQRPALVS